PSRGMGPVASTGSSPSSAARRPGPAKKLAQLKEVAPGRHGPPGSGCPRPHPDGAPMTSAVRLIRSQQLAQTAPYAYAATTAGPARAVWVAGACPLDASGATVAAGDYAGQTHQVMRNLATALADAGAALTDIAKTTVYVASARREDLVTAWNVYKEYMGAHDAPSTLLGVTVLGYDEQLVEVEAVAVVPGD